MRTYSIRAVLALAVVLAVSASAAAQSIVRGKVVDAQGKPIEGATITIEQVESNRKAQTKTDKNGEFMQIGLASGSYKVLSEKDKFKQQLSATVSRGRPVELSFQLTQTSGMTPEEIKNQMEIATLAKSALAAVEAGNDDDVIRQFTEILTKIPTCSDCYYNMGMAHSHKQQYAEAETAFNKAISMAPDRIENYTGLASVYNAQKKFDLAQQASAKAAELTSAGGGGGSAEALYNQGVILFNSQKFPEARVQFESAVKADPNMAMAQYQLGMTALNLGDFATAVTALEAYLTIDPNGPKAAEVKTSLPALQAMVKK